MFSTFFFKFLNNRPGTGTSEPFFSNNCKIIKVQNFSTKQKHVKVQTLPARKKMSPSTAASSSSELTMSLVNGLLSLLVSCE